MSGIEIVKKIREYEVKNKAKKRYFKFVNFNFILTETNFYKYSIIIGMYK